jgi:tRNA nucleotidyltransferase (CCA-adding enzyme)
MAAMAGPKISLNQTETNIRNLLIGFCKVLDQNSSSDQKTVLRITGGWVRDKLLGNQSHDIDIAINNTTGLIFAEALNQYIKQNASSLGLEARSIHKIDKNPDKSKHLETATTKLYGLDVDFVNLRAEEYADTDSRIPSTIRFGTPEEDAFRRDATLNALFYNLQEDKVEDFTGSGLRDLHKGVLRTPLPPFVTFDEDPLRVLRLIRFSSVLGFQIDNSAKEAMRDPRIKTAIIRKISRERVGVEIAKILAGPDPSRGLDTIADLGLEESIFLLLDAYKPTVSFCPPSSLLRKATAVLTSFPSLALHPQLQQECKRPSLWLAGALCHWGTIEAINDKKKPAPAVSLIIRDGVKLPTSEATLVAKMLAMEQETIQAATSAHSMSRKDFGLFIRKCGAEWRLCVLFGLMKSLMKELTDGAAVQLYNQLVQRVFLLSLEEAFSMKPLLNGKEVQQAYGIKKGGPWLAEALNRVIEYQLANPDASHRDCLDYVLRIKTQLEL